MTTSHSPLSALKAQADKIASTLKAAERGEKIHPVVAAKLAAARGKESIKIGVAMDDKLITINISWAKIRDADEAGLSEWIVQQMQGKSDAVH